MKLSTWFSVLKIARHLGKASAKLRRRVEHLFRDRLRRLATKRANRRRVHLGLGLAAGVWPLEERVLLSTATWVGGAGTLNWGDQANWSDDVLPTSTDEVVIGDLGDNQSIVVNMPVTIGSLNSAEGINVLGGQSLTITGAMSSAVTGPFTLASGATLSANSGASFNATGVTNIDGASLYASGGATISLPQLSSYLSTGNSIFQASGAGTSIYFPALSQLSNHSNDHERLNIQALEGGLIDLANLISITDPGAGSTSCRSVNIGADGVNSQIDLSSLMSFQDVDGSTWDWSYPGYSSLSASNGGTLLTPSLSTLDHVIISHGTGTIDTSQITVATGGRITIAGVVSYPVLANLAGTAVTTNTSITFSGVSNFDGGSISATGGAVVSFPLVSHYTSTGNSIFQASGAGTSIRFPELSQLSNDSHDHERLNIQALEGGLIDLANLISITDPGAGSTSCRSVNIGADGVNSQIDLSSLMSFQDVDGSTWDWSYPGYSSLSASNGGLLTLGKAGASLTFANVNISRVVNSFILMAGGAQAGPEFGPGRIVLQGAGSIAGDPLVSAATLALASGADWTIGTSLDLSGTAALQVDVAGMLRLSGSLTGGTTNQVDFTPAGKMLFGGSPVQQLEAMGQDLGISSAGYDANFAYERLELANNTTVQLVDEARNKSGTGAEAVYVKNLVVPEGTTLDLNGLNLYIQNGTIDGTVINGMVNQVPATSTTTTRVSTSTQSSEFGQEVLFTATVLAKEPGVGTPDGWVIFQVDDLNFGDAVHLVNGEASLATSALAVGAHSMSAKYYPSTSYFAESQASPISQTVTPATTTTALTSSANSSTYGTSVTFTATVTAGATGTVTFKEGSEFLGTGTISGGLATFSTSGLTAGNHTITAVYGGDGNYAGSTSSAVTQTVTSNIQATTTTLSLSATNVVYGQTDTFTATVSAATGTPTGSVQFLVDGVNYGSPVSLVSGLASLSLSGLDLGTHTIYAIYGGDGLFFTPSADAHSWISTVAGNGSFSVSGDGDAATRAGLGFPTCVAVDSSGNLYISDDYHHRVREVVKSTGIIITVAGNGSKGFSGDEAVATNAMLNTPGGVAVDNDGNLYIADGLNFRIREVVKATGQIITVAGNGTQGFSGDGGPATDAALNNYSGGLAVDSVGNVFFADSLNFRIREIVKATGTIITVAGNGGYGSSGDGGAATAAPIGTPQGLAIDNAGNLYIGDTYNHVVREVFRATGTIMTIAGNGTSGFSSDGDAATKAALGYPRYLAVDLNGNLFIGDDLNSVVREVVKSTGKIITVAGNKSYGFSGDGGAATEARLAYPRGLTVDSLGNLFIADSYNGRIRQVSPGLRLNVSPAATTLSLAWDGSTEYGQGRTITAVVQPVSPSTEILMTGSVQFLVDGVNYGGPVLLSGNKAELQDASLTAATHVITAVYTGDTNYTGSTAPAFIAEVHQAATNTSLTVSDDPSTYGNLVTFHADVTGGSLYLDVPGPSGSVTYYDGETILGTDWTSSSQEASFSTSVLGAGLHHFRAVYAGNSNYEGSSGSYDLTVNKASSATALSSSANPSTFGTSVTFTATVTAGVTGTVTFKEGSTVLGTGTISGGLATFITSGLTAGSHTITAEYAGDANYAGSTSGAVAQTVNQASSSTTLSSTANPSTYGTSVTFTATVTGSAGTPTGPVQFVVDGSNYGSPVTLVNGSAILAVSNLSTGKRGITAVYAGDGQNYAGSTASPLTQVVTASHQGTITTLSISGSSVVFGQAVTLIATVSASSGTPTGLVRFQLDGLDIGDPVALVDGTAQVQISSAAVGRHSVTARYLGTADLYAASTGVVNGLDTYIETIAGTGVGGYNGDGMAATNTTLFYPQSVAFDAEGNIFIADQVNHRIRQILKATGEVITVVGNGNAGYNGDNIPASDATLFYPSAVAIDQEGNLLIADQFNHRIREVVKATGLIKTVAGNGNAGYNGDGMAATDASLNQPLGFAIDSSGNLFFGDRYNHRVREVVKATGIIQTVAGTGVPGFSGNGMMATNAQVSEPLGVSVDSDGNIFFADFANHRIREIVEATGEIITVAGNGYAVYNGDGIAATEAGLFYPVNVTVNSHGNIYIADTYNNRIREVVKSTGLIGTVAGDGEPGFGGDGGLATSARLYLPEGVTFDDLGNLYISDLFNHAIRKLTSPGLIVSAASTTTVISTSDPQINAGELVTFTATVSASVGTPTGTVQFQIDGVNYGSPVSLTQGVASLVTSTLAAGIHSITAAYSSDTANYQDSLSDPISQTVNQGPVVTTQPIDAMIHPGEIATFTAAASGFPAPSVQWQVKTDGGNSGDFLGVDTSTQGNWKGVYGSEGYNTFEASSYPAYMSVNIGTNARYIYATGQTTDPRALQVAASGSTDRISAVWYTNDTMTTEVTFTDGASHRVAFYVMDADHRGRAERIDVIDRSTGEILDTRTVDQFDSGQYLSWNVKGSVGFKFTNLPGSLNAVFSGLFIDSNGQWQDIPGATTPTIRTDGTNLIRSIPLVNADFEAAPILGPGQTPVPVGAGKLIFTAPGSNADWYNQQISGIQGWLNATPNNGGVSSDSGLSRGDSLFGRDPQGQIAFINNWDRMMSQTVANQASAGDVLTASIESGTLGSDTDGGRAGTFYLVAGEANPENLDQFSSRSIVLAKLTVANHSWTHTQADVRVGNRVYVPLTLSYTYATNDPALGLPLTIAFRTELGSVGPTYWDNAALSVKTKLNGNQFRAVFTNELGTAISNPASLTIGAGSTATVLAGSTATSVYGQPVTFTATVTGNSGTPTGVVQFIVDGQNLGSPVSLNAAGTASLNLASLSVDTHTISASYAGDGQNYQGSASQDFNEQVTAAPTSTLLAGATTSAVYGQSVTFTATVSANAPSTAVATGSVQFLLDGVNYGDAVSLVAGVASLSLSSLAVGSHTVSASYTSSDSSFLNSSGVCVGTAGIIKTVAGTGNYGTSGDGGPATGAELTYVEGVATDADGNLYIADTQNNVIREVIKATGVIITVAGTGVADYTGDGGQATAATLFNPEGIVVDAAGNLFIADSGNNVIREVIRATGVIITVAGTGVADYTGDGGQATDATLDGAVGVAVDGAGNLFIADTYNNVIREVIAATSKIITVAGTGFSGYTGDGGAATDATLFHPLGLAMDGVGNVFIADMGNSVIRKVDQSTGMITTVAGNGYSGLAGDGGLATQAQLGNPNGVAVDGSGNLYISDSNNHVVRLVNAQTGFISTIVGTGSSGYSGDGAAASNATLHYPTDVALDTLGNLFISDTYNNVVREVSSSSIVVTGAATTTTVSSLAPSIVYGQSSTLRATVAAVAPSTSVPTGQVQFQVDGVNVGSPVDLVNGVASFELTQLNAGTHTVSASYLGDGVNMLGSSSSNVTQLVTRAALTIQAGDQSKTYGDTLDLGNSGFTATGLQYGETVGLVTLTSAGSTATVGVGTYAITPNAASGGTFNAGNYAITYQTGTLTVNKAHLTVSADAVSKTYDGQAFTGFTATISGFVNGETVGVLSGTASFSGAATTAVNAGSYAITVSQGTLTATNYDFTAFKAGTLTITKATATVVVTPYNVTYDGLSHTATVTSIAGVNGETGATVGTVTLNTTHTAAGSYAGDSWSFTGGTNYNNISITTITNTITKAHLTVSADAQTKTYDKQVFTGFTTTLTGFVNGETASVIAGTASFSGAATTAVNAGTYAITVAQGTLAATNYDFTAFNAGTLTISQRKLTVSATVVNREYDGTATATVNLTDNRVSGDVLSTSYGSALFPDANAGNKIVTVSGIAFSGSAAGNYYLFSTTATAPGNIALRQLTGTVTIGDKVYDGRTSAAITGYSLTGVISVESVNYAGGVASFADKNVASGKAVTVTGLYLTGAGSGNYKVNTTATGTAAITPFALTITATGVNKLYDGTTAATVTLADNRLAGDVFTSSYTSASFADSQAGLNKPVSVTGITISGADAGNYTYNSTASTTASISVGSTVPVVITQPVSQNVLPGAAVTLTAAASGSPAPSVQWQLSTNNGVTWSNIDGATSTSYSPATTLADNGKQFRAVFTNAAGNVTTTGATLTVAAAQIRSVGVQWGTTGTSNLVDASGGRLLPAGRITDLPWLNIDRLTITLSRAIDTLSPADITVNGVTVANYGPVTVSGSGTTWTITLSKAITDPDKVTVKLGNAQLGTYQRRLDVLPGDVNDDGIVNGQDILIVRNQVQNIIPTTLPLTFLDIDGNGVVDNTDMTLVSARNGKKLPR